MPNDPGKDALRRALKRSAASGGSPLASADQALTGNRQVTSSASEWLWVNLATAGGASSQVLVFPSTPYVSLVANDGAGVVSTLRVDATSIGVTYGTGVDHRINSAAGNDGHVFTSQGTGANPEWRTPEYMVPIWAEENAALGASNTYEWAYGNGANTPTNRGIVAHVPTGWSCQIAAMSLSINAGTATVEAEISGVLQGSTANVVISSGTNTVNTMSSPPAVVDGDVLNFRTTSSATTSAPCQACMWLRYYIA